MDGAISSVWGVSQLRIDGLENPDQVSDGVPQGETLIVGPGLPVGERVYEQLATGKLAPEALEMMQALKADLADACFSGDVGVQSLDNKEVTATALSLRAQQDSSFTGDTIWSLATTAIEPVARLAFQLMIQRVAEANTAELTDVIGEANALRLGSMAVRAPAQLFDAFEGAADITIEGLRLLAERGRDLSRMINFAQTAQLA